MLVVSRRVEEKLVFPDIPATVEVLAVKGNVVRLGVTAPADVVVHRAEVLRKAAAAAPPVPGESKEARHAVRNRLNAVTVGLALLRRQQAAGMADAAAETAARLDAEVKALSEALPGLAAAVAPPAPKKPARRQRALLVEDDHNERELLAGFLRMAGLDVVGAGDGSEAMDYLRGNARPDAVLLDMMMPQLDGPSTVRLLRHDPAFAGLKIIGISGHAPEQFNLSRGPGGVDGWFQKPLDPERLLAELSHNGCA